MAFNKRDYIVRSGAQIIAVRKDWGAAQESVDKWVKELLRLGQQWKRTRAQTHKNPAGESIHATYHYIGDRPGALMTITINRGS